MPSNCPYDGVLAWLRGKKLNGSGQRNFRGYLGLTEANAMNRARVEVRISVPIAKRRIVVGVRCSPNACGKCESAVS